MNVTNKQIVVHMIASRLNALIESTILNVITEDNTLNTIATTM